MRLLLNVSLFLCVLILGSLALRLWLPCPCSVVSEDAGVPSYSSIDLSAAVALQEPD